ncbi:prevent-host-death protein [Streptomyces sp. V2]|uniref:prevent-host-death protein n=2 Tax=Streptomyces TaxID=1883 RepID=UPI0019D1C786|nr:prevent-host-death protein [Streptomyces sp. V2]
MPAVHFENYTEARTHLKELLDAVVDAERLRHHLSSMCPSKAEVVAEAGGWSVFIPGLPVTADGPTFDEAVNEMVDALREYADDWQERLRLAPNHQDNWGLVQLIALSDDRQLTDWLVDVRTATARQPRPANASPTPSTARSTAPPCGATSSATN